jgi:hypothetical protein
MSKISHLFDEIESPAPKQYTGRFESYFVFLSYLIFGLYRIILLSTDSQNTLGYL